MNDAASPHEDSASTFINRFYRRTSIMSIQSINLPSAGTPIRRNHPLRRALRCAAAALPAAIALALHANPAAAAAGSLAANMDAVNNEVDVYAIPEGQTSIVEFSFNGSWSSTDLMTAAGAPAATPGSPIAAYENTVNSDPEIFYLTPDSNGGNIVEQMYTTFWFLGNITASSGAQAAGEGSGLVGYMDNNNGSDNVFYQGTDGYIHLMSWTSSGGWVNETSIANKRAAAPGSALTGHATSNSEELFFIGTNRHVYELWRWSLNFDGWHLTDVTEANGAKPLAKAGSPLASFYDPSAGVDAVFYVGTDKHLHEALFANGVWEAVDVTDQSGAPEVGPGSALAAHLNTGANSEEVYYELGNKTIEQVYTFSTSTPSWVGGNTFTGNAAKAKKAVSASALATDMDSVFGTPLVDELYYFDGEGVVNEVYAASNTNGWNIGVP
jgi:hypothetical protein